MNNLVSDYTSGLFFLHSQLTDPIVSSTMFVICYLPLRKSLPLPGPQILLTTMRRRGAN